MKQRSSPSPDAFDYPEFVVSREAFDRYFEKPMPTSTFHDLVHKGKIIPFKHMRGRFLLNASLRRLGLREVSELPRPPSELSLEDIVRLAFSMIDSDLFPRPRWMQNITSIPVKDLEHAHRLISILRGRVEKQESPQAKLAYLESVLDWASIMDRSG